MFLDQIKVNGFMLLLGSEIVVMMSLFMWLAVWIVCRNSILNLPIASLTPADIQTRCPRKVMQFLAAGHKIRIGFLRNLEQNQMNSDKI